MEYKYAVLNKKNGQVIDFFKSKDQIGYLDKYYPNLLEYVEISNTSKIEVVYTELGGPWGYGHQEVSFETYGGIKRCIINLYKWMKSETEIWGPDWRDIQDYFSHCNLYVNGEDKTSWLRKQVNSLNKKMLYV